MHLYFNFHLIMLNGCSIYICKDFIWPRCTCGGRTTTLAENVHEEKWDRKHLMFFSSERLFHFHREINHLVEWLKQVQIVCVNNWEKLYYHLSLLVHIFKIESLCIEKSQRQIIVSLDCLHTISGAWDIMTTTCNSCTNAPILNTIPALHS